jgi:hypothetical protein
MFIALLGGADALPVLRQTMLDGGPNPFVPSGGSSSTGGSSSSGSVYLAPPYPAFIPDEKNLLEPCFSHSLCLEDSVVPPHGSAGVFCLVKCSAGSG